MKHLICSFREEAANVNVSDTFPVLEALGKGKIGRIGPHCWNSPRNRGILLSEGLQILDDVPSRGLHHLVLKAWLLEVQTWYQGICSHRRTVNHGRETLIAIRSTEITHWNFGILGGSPRVLGMRPQVRNRDPVSSGRTPGQVWIIDRSDGGAPGIAGVVQAGRYWLLNWIGSHGPLVRRDLAPTKMTGRRYSVHDSDVGDGDLRAIEKHLTGDCSRVMARTSRSIGIGMPITVSGTKTRRNRNYSSMGNVGSCNKSATVKYLGRGVN